MSIKAVSWQADRCFFIILNMQKIKTNHITLIALFTAIGLVLPFLTGQIPQIGAMLSPLHYPVFICAFLCGRRAGALTGLILPPLRSLFFGMPPLYPTALAMAAELCTYGLLAGSCLPKTPDRRQPSLYKALLTAMVGGRIIWGLVMFLLLQPIGQPFTWQTFLSGALIGALPGIILQLLIIPPSVSVLEKLLTSQMSLNEKQVVQQPKS
ncbi:MAG: ECF transporter S component [Candidatus Bruticola sp.]